MMHLSTLIFVALRVTLVRAAPSVTQLSDGKDMEYGTLSNGVAWQSSGILTKGCTTQMSISDCYGISLTSDPNQQLDPGSASPRQRVEFRAPNQASGTSMSYSWKHYLDQSVGTSSHFFHLMQIFDKAAGSPIVTLDAVNGRLQIADDVRTACGGVLLANCPSVPLSRYSGRTTLHQANLTVGANGFFNYLVTDAASGEKIISYTATGAFGSNIAYVKYGTYRATFSPGMTPIIAAAGDYTAQTI